jgi:hypothetical protein
MRFGILIAVLIREKSNRSRPTPIPLLLCADIFLLDFIGKKKLAVSYTDSIFNGEADPRKTG